MPHSTLNPGLSLEIDKKWNIFYCVLFCHSCHSLYTCNVFPRETHACKKYKVWIADINVWSFAFITTMHLHFECIATTQTLKYFWITGKLHVIFSWILCTSIVFIALKPLLIHQEYIIYIYILVGLSQNITTPKCQGLP